MQIHLQWFVFFIIWVLFLVGNVLFPIMNSVFNMHLFFTRAIQYAVPINYYKECLNRLLFSILNSKWFMNMQIFHAQKGIFELL